MPETKPDIATVVKKALIDSLGVDTEFVVPEKKLVDLGADAVDILDILEIVEDELVIDMLAVDDENALLDENATVQMAIDIFTKASQ